MPREHSEVRDLVEVVRTCVVDLQLLQGVDGDAAEVAVESEDVAAPAVGRRRRVFILTSGTWRYGGTCCCNLSGGGELSKIRLCQNTNKRFANLFIYRSSQ